ncbi:MAG: phenylalanine--tRNA ligase subunit beta [Chloroflexi bacterium]|nr:phenylalanine--tRNA ligase subunit beta [Chloroflexota bacterium]
MRVPLSWLKKYVPIVLPPEELAHRLTMAGVEVGQVEQIGGDWDRDKVLVGRVVKVDRHPNADRLTLPTVDLGNDEAMTVVCGAPNVAGGQKIAFAREGARLFSTRSGKVEPLKSARIRGVPSSGMVCSALELGLGEDHEGILVLDDDAPVGTPLADYLGDVVLDIEVTPNRPDCLAILGVAHEAAALTGQTVTEPDLSYPEDGRPIEDQVRVEIADPELCYRYTASLITGVKMGPSPRWMQDALVRAGQRPVNGIVDITNYVMLEYGQPLHAFDFGGVKERTIIVRAARAGEVLVTLDGERRTLGPPMLTIADAEDAVGLAGVMGGANTEMHEGTTSVLLESANFDPVNTRRTASALRLNTEASHRFERSIRAELAPLALRRATQLILEIAGGEAAQGIIDLYPGEKERPAVRISRERIKKVLGVDYEMSEVEGVLSSLGFERSEPEMILDRIDRSDGPLWVTVPYWRSDISIEDDLIEEVARITGYDNIPMTTLSAPIPHHEPQTQRSLREQVRDLLAAAGMQEIISYNLTSLETLKAVQALDDVAEPLRVTNPMSGEQEYLRTSLRGSVLSTLASNRKTIGAGGIRIFEVGRVFLPRDEARERDLPEEREMLAGALSGPRFLPSWRVPTGEMDFFDAKGVLESVFSALGLQVEYEKADDAILHPGKTARLSCGGTAIGVVGEVHPTVRARFDLGQSPVALFEIDIESLATAMSEAGRSYRSTSRFPQSHRDLALIVDQDVPSARIQAIIKAHGLVVGSAPFDVYSGEGVPAGKKSVAYAITFQSTEGTLTSEQVDQAQDSILRQLEREVGASLRG